MFFKSSYCLTISWSLNSRLFLQSENWASARFEGDVFIVPRLSLTWLARIFAVDIWCLEADLGKRFMLLSCCSYATFSGMYCSYWIKMS